MSGSPPRWIQPERDEESPLALDLVPPASDKARLWLFLPGLASHRRGEKALYFARQIAKRGDAFAGLDWTGHGDSGGSLFDLSLSRNLRDLERGLAFAAQEAGPFRSTCLIGSSMGGLAALWFAARHPDRVQAVTVIAPAFEMAGRMLLAAGAAEARRWREQGKRQVKTANAEFELGYRFVEDESRYPTSGLLASLKTPTLIVHGVEDDIVPHHLSIQFSRKVESAELVLIEGGDHRLTAYKERIFEHMWDFVSRRAPC